MEHETRKLNDFIRYMDTHDTGVSYGDILNRWMNETGSRILSVEEMRFYIDMIPMALKRKTCRKNQEKQTA